MNALKILATLVLSTVLFSCGGSSGKSKLKISLASVTGSANFPGGVIVTGKNLRGDKSFARQVPAGDLLEVELDIGEVWNFAAMGWDGNTGLFEGKNYCAFALNVGIKEEFTDIPMDMLAINCAANAINTTYNFFGQTGPETGTPAQFPKVVFNSCGEVRSYIEEGQAIDPSIYCGPGNSFEVIPGGMKSFKIKLGQRYLDGFEIMDLESRCIQESTQSDGGSNKTRGYSQVKLPLGSPSFELAYQVEAYPTTDCSGTPDNIYFWDKGLKRETGSQEGYAAYDAGSNRNQLVLHANLCNQAQRDATPFGNGSPAAGETRLICNPTHWNNINADLASHAAQSYSLGNDVVFNAGNTTFTNTFSGKLRGNGYTISNGTQPLLGDVEVNATEQEDVRISNLNISNMTVSISGGDLDSFGILAKRLRGNGIDKRLELGHITLDGSNSITAADSVATGRNIGGLIGEVNFNGGPIETEFFLREIDIRATVDTSNDTRVGSTTGGVIGYTEGGTSGNYYLVLEEFLVGVNDETRITSDFSGRNTVIGVNNVGGVIGMSVNTEIRGFGAVHSSVAGENSVGGVIGYASNKIDLHGVYVNTILDNNASSVGNNFGGAIGYITNTIQKRVQLRDLFIDVSMATNANYANKVGGAVGGVEVNSDAGGNYNFSISNVKTDVDLGVNGSQIGGIIGHYQNNAGSTGQSDPIIYNSLVTGNIYVETSADVGNPIRGGFIGQVNLDRVELSRVELSSLAGYHTLGGAFGLSTGGSVIESEIKFSPLQPNENSAAALNTGGVIGRYVNPPVPIAGVVNRVRAQGTILISNVSPNCTTGGTCGLLIGNNASTENNLMQNSVIDVTMTGPTGGATEVCGAATNCADGTNRSNVFPSASNGDCTTLSGLPEPFIWNSGTSQCRTAFATKWDQYGKAGTYIRAGNMVEPFRISSPAQWNGIQTDKLLVSKSYELTGPINFNNGTFNPLGGTTVSGDNAFSGNIISNGHALQNITFSTGAGTDGVGIVPVLKGSIGNRDEPLYIENLTMTCDDGNCGVVGFCDSGDVHVAVKGGNYNTSSSGNYIGGLVGYMGNYCQISSGGFAGNINGANYGFVGGIIGGHVAGVNTNTFNLNIEDVYARIGTISGANGTGGFMGYFNGGQYDSLSIQNSYVKITGGVSTTGTFSGGVFGNVGSTFNAAELENVYVDYRGASFNADPNVFGAFIPSNSAGNYSVSSNGKVVALPAVVGKLPSSGNVQTSTDTTSAYNDHFKDDGGGGGDKADFNLDASGDLKLDWEVNGFEDN